MGGGSTVLVWARVSAGRYTIASLCNVLIAPPHAVAATATATASSVRYVRGCDGECPAALQPEVIHTYIHTHTHMYITQIKCLNLLVCVIYLVFVD